MTEPRKYRINQNSKKIRPTGSSTIARFLKKKIKEKNVTMYRLSIKSNCSQTGVQRICSGEVMPSVATFIAICQALEVSPEEMGQFYKEFKL